MLLDTDVFSFLMKPGDTRASLYKKHVDGKIIAVSFVTVGELLFGAEKKKWGAAKQNNLNGRLKSVVVVPYDRELCATYARTKALVQESGKPVSDNDLWIAACAIRHGIPLVSHNRKHFAHIPGLVLISEQVVADQLQSQESLNLVESDTSVSSAPLRPTSLSSALSED